MPYAIFAFAGLPRVIAISPDQADSMKRNGRRHYVFKTKKQAEAVKLRLLQERRKYGG